MPLALTVKIGNAIIPVPELARQHDLDRKLVSKRFAKAKARGLPPDEALKEALQPKKPDPISPRYITVGNQTKTVIEWSKDRGIPESTIRMRLDRDKWTKREALEFDERQDPMPPIDHWVLDEMGRQGWTVQKLEQKSGVTVEHWKRGSVPVLANLIVVIMTLGFRLKVGGQTVWSEFQLVDWMFYEAKKFGISIRGISKISGVPFGTVSDWKIRRRTPLLSTFTKCLDALGLKFPKPVKR